MKTNLPRIARGVLAVCGVFLASGCLKINTTVSINPDGSGTWQLIYAMPTHVIRQVQMTRELTMELAKAGSATATNPVAKPLDIPMLFDETAVRARFALLEREGIKLTKLQTRSRSGWQYVDMAVSFTRIETLVRQRFFDDCGVSFKQTAERVQKIVVSLPDGNSGAGEERLDMADPDVNTALTPFMKGLIVAVHLEVPGDIRNSNSSVSDARHAMWEWDFEKDPKAVARLFKDKIVLVFDSAGVRIKDFEKPAAK